MEKEVKEKILSIIRKDNSLKYKIEAWKNRFHPNWNILEVWQCIYDFAQGKSTVIADIINKLSRPPKVYGRANAAYGTPSATNGMEIVRNEDGVLELRGYNPSQEPPLKGQHGHDNDRIFRKSDDAVKKDYERMEQSLLDIGKRLRALYPAASNDELTLMLAAIKDRSDRTKKNISLVMSRLERGVYKFTSDYRVAPKGRTDESRCRVFVVTEAMVEALRKENEMTEYKFYSNVKKFLHDLLVDPVNAKPSDLLRMHRIDRYKLLHHLTKLGAVTKKEKISDKDENGEPKTATMKVRYAVPKKNLDRKLKKLYIKFFEKNIPSKNEPIDECDCGGACGCGGTEAGATSCCTSGCPGAFDIKFGQVQRRKIKEDTACDSVGNYQYDTPFLGDEETMSRGDGIGGSTSINRVDERFGQRRYNKFRH